MNKVDFNRELSHSKVFITGAGYLTTNILRKWKDIPYVDFVVYSRDEGKHDLINREFPKVQCIIGDIKDFDRMSRAARGCSYGIFTASTKCIDRVESNLEESLFTIGLGAINSKKVAEDNLFESAIFLSTDKAVLPQTSYGNLKAFASSVFLNNNSKTNSTRFSVVRYGNISASNKSLLDIIFNFIHGGRTIVLNHEDMTRFYLDIDRGIESIEDAIFRENVTIVPNIKSFKVKDIFDIYAKEFGLKYEIGQLRLNEKLHEHLFTKDETYRTTYDEDSDNFIVKSSGSVSNPHFTSHVDISSDMFVVDYKEIYQYLKDRRFFQKRS